MRLFQILGIPPSYKPRLQALKQNAHTFREQSAVFLADRYAASHVLKPVLDGDPGSCLTVGNDEDMQRAWARENGLGESATLEEILLAQIEEHRADVVYNLDPLRFDSAFVRKLPGGVKHKLCWRAAPSPNPDFGAYDLVLCNFPSIMDMWVRMGFKSAYFAPAHDPAMDAIVDRAEKTVDIVFVGGFSRHHKRRTQLLEAIASLASGYRVVLSLDVSRLTQLAETPLGILPPLRSHRRPEAIRKTSTAPTWGRDLYSLLASSKIVFNGAIDMAGEDRGNQRCFETMGCGALLVTDEGRYPPGMVGDETMITYNGQSDVVDVLRNALRDWTTASEIAKNGLDMIRTQYSKDQQWRQFVALL